MRTLFLTGITVERTVCLSVGKQRDDGSAYRLESPGRSPCCLEDVEADLKEDDSYDINKTAAKESRSSKGGERKEAH